MPSKNQFKSAQKWFIENCEYLGPVVKEIGPVKLDLHPGTFEVLVSSIVSQQLSIKAAQTIHQRLVSLVDGDVNPKRLAALQAEEYQRCGISRQKQGYMYDLAARFIAEPELYIALDKLDDAEVIKRLVMIKGIGVWTAQMYLIFSLGRPDVFPVDDLGVRLGMQRVFGWKEIPGKSELIEVSIRWSPYRSAASWYLWRYLELSRKSK